jgi:uncharacterized protein YsxB (DUF464 family)
MIKIEITRDDKQGIAGFSVQGHAYTAPHGHDIVCAGVSALTQTAVLGLERHLGRRLNLEIGDGRLKMKLQEEPDALSNAILETMCIGLSEIAKKNPRSVRILEHGR